MMNIIELQDDLKQFSKDQLVQEMQAPTGTAPQYLVLSELQRRKRMEDEYATMNNNVGPTVAEQAVNAAGIPAMAAQDMSRSLAPQTDMAQNTGMGPGGPVQMMQEGGPVGLRSLDPRERMMRGRYGATEEEILRQLAAQQGGVPERFFGEAIDVRDVAPEAGDQAPQLSRPAGFEDFAPSLPGGMPLPARMGAPASPDIMTLDSGPRPAPRTPPVGGRNLDADLGTGFIGDVNPTIENAVGNIDLGGPGIGSLPGFNPGAMQGSSAVRRGGRSVSPQNQDLSFGLAEMLAENRFRDRGTRRDPGPPRQGPMPPVGGPAGSISRRDVRGNTPSAPVPPGADPGAPPQLSFPGQIPPGVEGGFGDLTAGTGFNPFAPQVSEEDVTKELTKATEKVDNAAVKPLPGGGSSGGSASVSSSSSAPAGYEGAEAMLMARLADLEEQREEAKWMSLAEFGLGLMASNTGNFGTDVGIAGMGAMEGFKESLADMQDDEDAILDAQLQLAIAREDQASAMRLARMKAASKAAGRGSGSQGLPEISADNERWIERVTAAPRSVAAEERAELERLETVNPMSEEYEAQRARVAEANERLRNAERDALMYMYNQPAVPE